MLSLTVVLEYPAYTCFHRCTVEPFYDVPFSSRRLLAQIRHLPFQVEIFDTCQLILLPSKGSKEDRLYCGTQHTHP